MCIIALSKNFQEGLIMNDQLIKELAKQAGYEPDMFGVGHWDMPECKKLAELIARECVDVLNKRFMGDLNREDKEVRRCIEDVKKHFGLE